MSVHADDQAWASEARQVLEQTGAEDISSIGASRRNVASTHRPARLEPVA